MSFQIPHEKSIKLKNRKKRSWNQQEVLDKINDNCKNHVLQMNKPSWIQANNYNVRGQFEHQETDVFKPSYFFNAVQQIFHHIVNPSAIGHTVRLFALTQQKIYLQWKMQLLQVCLANLFYSGDTHKIRYPRLCKELLSILKLQKSDVILFDSYAFLQIRNNSTEEHFYFPHTRTFLMFTVHNMEPICIYFTDGHKNKSLVLLPGIEHCLQSSQSPSEEQDNNLFKMKCKLLQSVYANARVPLPIELQKHLSSAESYLQFVIGTVNLVLKNAYTIYEIYHLESSKYIFLATTSECHRHISKDNPFYPIIQFLPQLMNVTNSSSSSTTACEYKTEKDKKHTKEKIDFDNLSFMQPENNSSHYFGTSVSGGVSLMSKSKLQLPRSNINVMERFIKSSATNILSIRKRLGDRGFNYSQLEENPYFCISLHSKDIVEREIVQYIQQVKLSTHHLIELELWALDVSKKLSIHQASSSSSVQSHESGLTCVDLLSNILCFLSVTQFGPWFGPFDKLFESCKPPQQFMHRLYNSSLSVCGVEPVNYQEAFQTLPKLEKKEAASLPTLIKKIVLSIEDFYSKHSHLCIQNLKLHT